MQRTKRISKAEVSTANAVSYMKQLCRHWAHRFPVEFDDARGTIELPQAQCVLTASPTMLAVSVELSAELQEGADQERIEKVVEEHLQRFGFRETLVFRWTRQ